MKIGILGRTEMLYRTIKALSKHGHDIAFIGTCRAPEEYSKKETDFEDLASELHIPYFCDIDLYKPNVQHMMNTSHADVCVSINWLTILGHRIIELFPHGILNGHAGDLPRYRGNACMNWALLMGEERVCMTIHKMEPGELDAGDILLKQYKDINRGTRIGELYSWLNEVTPEMFAAAIEGLSNGTLHPVPQSKDPSHVLRCYPRKPEDGLINWNDDAFYIERLVNASSEPFVGAFSYINNERITIWRAVAQELKEPSLYVRGQVLKISHDTGSVLVGCENGALEIQQISINTCVDRVYPNDYIKSHRTRFNSEAIP